jgi:hypothetical protein
MKTIILLLTVFLIGCTKTVPVRMDFPQAPEILLKKCENLKQVESNPIGTPITDLFKVIIENYTLYHECSNRVDGWQDWYKSMQNIYGGIRK